MPAVSRKDLRTVLSGVLMGAADIIPGVSGGTVALILGIYGRLVTAISHFDAEAVLHVTSRRWQAAADHVDLRFVIALGCGVVTGIGGLSFLMKTLLEEHLQLTYAVFFGLILGSGVLVARAVREWKTTTVCSLVAGTVLAWFVVALEALRSPPDTLWYLFLCGAVGICAMILPGLSGAFILLVLRRYSHVTDLIRSVLKGDWTLEAFTEITVFCTGCLFGLLAFSRVLRWLLTRHTATTMATLCGLMLGSLRRLWPFKVELTPPGTEFKFRRYENVLPNAFDGTTLATFGLVLVAVVGVIAMEAIARRAATEHEGS